MSSSGKQLQTRKSRCVLNPAVSKTEERCGEVLAVPPGLYPNTAFNTVQVSRENDTKLIVKRSWDIALAPTKQIPMNLFIMYMAGGSISLFPLMMIGVLFLRVVKALFSINATFALISGSHSIPQKIVFLLGNLATLGLVVYKCSSMGLLPTYASDWLDFVEPAQRVEYSGGGLNLS
ncbi:ER membrane protein complex subunit 4 [Galendromus occidentalis]|uniref:ER membrane protein complex subunit 4 n=1 Tax=Galendromus occidentalis TaxID=34638 RepID=A0AAJ6VWB0_9ACAR|nr:ER membrane protein complex subunit 4 [Galendromus occidentalis]